MLTPPPLQALSSNSVSVPVCLPATLAPHRAPTALTVHGRFMRGGGSRTHNVAGTPYPFPKDLFMKFINENNGYFPVVIESLPEARSLPPLVATCVEGIAS